MKSTSIKILLFFVVLLSLTGSSLAQLTAKPKPAPASWRPLIGEYVHDSDTVIILEKDGALQALLNRADRQTLKQSSGDKFQSESNSTPVVFTRDSRGKVTQVQIGTSVYKRRPLGPEEGSNQLRVEPLRPVPTLIKEARTAQPPEETGDFLPTDLVELRKLDPTIKL